MNSWRRTALLATTAMVAFAASMAPAPGVGATVPPVTDPAPTDVASERPADQVVHSWALIPATVDLNQSGSRNDLTYVADGGTVIEDAVTLLNLGTEMLTFRVFATDAFNNSGGQFDVLPTDQKPENVGSWVTFAQEMVSVPAGQQATIPITITIPAGASAGDHVGAVLASSPTVGDSGNGQVITMDRRTGTRIYLRVNGPLFPQLAISNLDTTYDQAVNPLDGTAHINFSIVNSGNVRLSGTPHVTVHGPFGFAEKSVVVPDIAELLPGEQVDLSVEVDGAAAAFLDSTSVRVDALGAADLGEVADATASDSTFAPPLFLLGMLLVLLFGLLAFRAYRRRATATVARADDEQLVCELEHQPS